MVKTTRHQRIEIQRRVLRGANSIGELVYEWKRLWECWGQAGDGFVRIRFHPGVVVGQRVITPAGEFEIRNIVQLPSKHPLLKLEFSDVSEHASRAAMVQRFESLPWPRYKKTGGVKS